ncbi:MAG: hypothetical protein WC277_11885, partial [Bacilli bacterium]
MGGNSGWSLAGGLLGALGGSALSNYVPFLNEYVGPSLMSGLLGAGGTYIGATHGDKVSSDKALQRAVMGGMGGYMAGGPLSVLTDRSQGMFFGPDSSLSFDFSPGGGGVGGTGGKLLSGSSGSGGLFSGGLGGNAGLLGLTALGALSSMEEQKDANKRQEEYNRYITQNLGSVANEGKYLPAMQNAVNAT